MHDALSEPGEPLDRSRKSEGFRAERPSYLSFTPPRSPEVTGSFI